MKLITQILRIHHNFLTNMTPQRSIISLEFNCTRFRTREKKEEKDLDNKNRDKKRILCRILPLDGCWLHRPPNPMPKEDDPLKDDLTKIRADLSSVL